MCNRALRILLTTFFRHPVQSSLLFSHLSDLLDSNSRLVSHPFNSSVFLSLNWYLAKQFIFGIGIWLFFCHFWACRPQGDQAFRVVWWLCVVCAVYIGNIVFVFLTKCLTNRSSALLTLQFCCTRESSAYFFFS